MKPLSLIVGAIAILIFNYSLLQKSKSKILIYQIIANIFYALQYVFLGLFTAPVMNVINITRSIYFYQKEEQKKTIPFISLAIFLTLCLIFGIITYENIYSIIPIAITMLYAIATYQKNILILRVIFLICALIWILYNLQVEAYSGLIGNILEVICSIISLIKYHRKSIQ